MAGARARKGAWEPPTGRAGGGHPLRPTQPRAAVRGRPLFRAGSDAQKAEGLPRIASGEIVTSFALTEPGAGSDSASVQTPAVRDGKLYPPTRAESVNTNAHTA